MSTLMFDRTACRLTLTSDDGSDLGSWDAANNVDSRSQGPWLDGMYAFNYYLPHPGDDANSAYGSHGIFIFTVPGRDAMGVHSGRAEVPDGRGRVGYQHCTLGCVRTTDDATAQLVRIHGTDPIASITLGG